jgi:hypothetical protein
MNPCADLSVPTVSQQLQESLPPPLPSRRNLQSYSDPSLGETFNDSLSDDYEMSVYVEDDMDDVDNSDHIMLDRQWKYEDQPYYDDIFHDEEYIEDHFNSDEEDSSDASANNVNCFYYDEENDTTVYNHDKAHFASASATTRIVDLEQQRQS